MGAKPAAGKGLRIASGCSTLDEFTAVFRKFCTPNSIFIATRVPRPSGIAIRFAITLKDGKAVMSGAGTIVESFETKNNRYERSGMVVEFSKLDTMGRILLRELNASSTRSAPTPEANKGKKKSENFEVPTVVSDPDEATLAATRRSEERAAVVPSDAPAADDESKSEPDADASDSDAEAPSAEAADDAVPERAKGSSIILPANPFGELAAKSLEAFIECTLYEETGELDISAMDAGQNPVEEIPLAPPKDTVALDDLLEPEPEIESDAESRRAKYIPRPPKIPASAQVHTPPPPTPPAKPRVPDIPVLAPTAPPSHEVIVSDKSLDEASLVATPPVATTPVTTPAPAATMSVATPAPVTTPAPTMPIATMPVTTPAPTVPVATPAPTTPVTTSAPTMPIATPPPVQPPAPSAGAQAATGPHVPAPTGPGAAGVQAVALAPLIPTPVMAAPSYVGADGQPSAPHVAPPSRTITFTWNQAIGLVGLCVVAGLGFGLLASGGGNTSEDPAARPTPVSSHAAPLAKKNTEALAEGRSNEPEAPTEAPKTAMPEPADLVVASESTPSVEAEPVVAEPVAAEPVAAEPLAAEPLAATTVPPTAPTEPFAQCNLRLDLIPKDGIVVVGGVAVQRGAKQATVPCGTQPLVVKHPRYLDHRGEIVVHAETPSVLRLRMKRPIVTLRVLSTPSKATVSINKRRAGKAPLKRNIPAFESVQVTVSSPGYQTYKRKVYPKKNTTMNVRLRKSATKPRRSTVSRRN